MHSSYIYIWTCHSTLAVSISPVCLADVGLWHTNNYQQLRVGHSGSSWSCADDDDVITVTTYYWPTDLVVNNELWELVEDGILSFCQRTEVFQHILWMNVGWSRVHDVICLIHQLSNTQCILMMEVVLSTVHNILTTFWKYTSVILDVFINSRLILSVAA